MEATVDRHFEPPSSQQLEMLAKSCIGFAHEQGMLRYKELSRGQLYIMRPTTEIIPPQVDESIGIPLNDGMRLSYEALWGKWDNEETLRLSRIMWHDYVADQRGSREHYRFSWRDDQVTRAQYALHLPERHERPMDQELDSLPLTDAAVDTIAKSALYHSMSRGDVSLLQFEMQQQIAAVTDGQRDYSERFEVSNYFRD